MKRLLLILSLAILSASSTAVFAAPRHGDGDGDGHRQHHRHAVPHRGHHDNGLHRGHYKQAFRRGQRIPVVYLQPRYYVQDYRAYRLAPPPRGYRWVRPDDGRYLLIATATGLIAQILGD